MRPRPAYEPFFPSLALAAGSPGTNGTEVICKGDESDKEANMNRTLVGIILFAAGAATTPAFADFYIVQDASTHRCRIVEERPAPSVGVVVGIHSGPGWKLRVTCGPLKCAVKAQPAAVTMSRLRGASEYVDRYLLH